MAAGAIYGPGGDGRQDEDQTASMPPGITPLLLLLVMLMLIPITMSVNGCVFLLLHLKALYPCS